MKTKRFKIGKKIALGYVVILALTVISGLNSVLVLRQSRAVDDEVSKVYLPSLKKLEQLDFLALNTKKLINAWIYQPNQENKEALNNLLLVEFPALSGEIADLSSSWRNEQNQEIYKNILENFTIVFEAQKSVKANLNTFEDYDDDIKVDNAINLYDNIAAVKIDEILEAIEIVATDQKVISDQLVNKKYQSFNRLEMIMIILTLIAIIIGSLSAYLTTKSITNPVNSLKDIIDSLGKGRLPEVSLKKRRDEIGEMAASVEDLVDGLQRTSEFAKEIGNGNFDAEFNALSEEDVLGNALIDMRANLKQVAEDDEKRNWLVAGLAKFGDILRSHDEDLKVMASNIMSNLVKYIDANQGGLFIVNDDNPDEEFLELITCYAWDREKFLEQKILKGEGLAGQCWQEGKPIYLTGVPDVYIKISSGLGQANPKSILIIPLLINDQIYGVLELASFNEFEDYHREFLEKLAENMASTLSSVRTNSKTKLLLEDTQQQAEEMRAQEEEMRQNQEELQATQEELGRQKAEMENEVATLKKELEKFTKKSTKSTNGQKVETEEKD